MKKCYPFLLKNWLRFGLAVAFVAVFSLTLHAQNGLAKQWDRTFGGNGMDVLSTLQQTSDGGYILGGGSESGINGTKTAVNKGKNDYWVIKLDTNGNNSWDKTFG